MGKARRQEFSVTVPSEELLYAYMSVCMHKCMHLYANLFVYDYVSLGEKKHKMPCMGLLTSATPEWR